MKVAFFILFFMSAVSCSGPGGTSAEDRDSSDRLPLKFTNAGEFLKDAEERLAKIQDSSFLAEWVKSNFITQDTTAIASELGAQWTELATSIAKGTRAYKGGSAGEQRKLDQFFLGLNIPGPVDTNLNQELSELKSELESMYGSGKSCNDSGECRNLQQLSEVIETSRDPKELLKAWVAWRTVAAPMKGKYARTVALGNIGSKELGFANTADLWKSKYDMSPKDFEASLEKVWSEVKPLYEQLHCFVRDQLNKKYGDSVVEKKGLIPAHLLGNMWAQSWSNIYDLMDMPSGQSFDPTSLLKKAKYTPEKMVKTAENFFVSLGMPKLPGTFYERSLFTKPRDREVVCHASAWHMNRKDDVRIKMCIKIDDDNFRTIHHELGHIYYYLAYQDQPLPFQNSANDGFHEAMGDTLELSMTPQYFKSLGLLSQGSGAVDEIPYLMKMALGKLAFLPFGLMVDQWRWKVFSGELPEADYNTGWWRLREQYQGLKAPVRRELSDFDPGAKYHIPAYTPYSRYFLAHILQFQFHKALCATSGHTGPLHECSIYGSKEAGKRIWDMMQLGSSRPWPEALRTLTGKSELSAAALREYFSPLEKWLVKKNTGLQCGW